LSDQKGASWWGLMFVRASIGKLHSQETWKVGKETISCSYVYVYEKKVYRILGVNARGLGKWKWKLYYILYTRGYRRYGGGAQIKEANWLVVSLTCDLARSSKCRHTCFASRSGQLSQGYNWRIWPTPRNRTEHNTRINTFVWQDW